MIAPILGPAPCGGCRRPVWYFRALGWAEPTGRKTVPWTRHGCHHGDRCGAVMPMYGDRCARRRGHRTEHRSRYAMDNAARQRWRGFEA